MGTTSDAKVFLCSCPDKLIKLSPGFENVRRQICLPRRFLPAVDRISFALVAVSSPILLNSAVNDS